MPAEGASKDKEGITTLEADKPANQTSKFQIKLKKWALFCNLFRTFVRGFVYVCLVVVFFFLEIS